MSTRPLGGMPLGAATLANAHYQASHVLPVQQSVMAKGSASSAAEGNRQRPTSAQKALQT